MPKENKTPHVSSVNPIEPTEEAIRVRAYQLYEERGCEEGHDFDDWLQAEAEIAGKKANSRAHSTGTLHKMAAA